MKEGRMVVDPDGMTSRRKVFAGGDVATGEGTVSEAIGSGKSGALAIRRYLENGSGEKESAKPEVVNFEELNPDYFYPAPKVPAGHLDPKQAIRSFDEVCLGYPEDQASKEAQRCFGCAAPPTYKVEDCRGCVNCEQRCPASAITIEPRQEPLTVGVDPAQFDPDEIMRICKRAKVHPKQTICYCTNTTAGEIAAAILKGAKTPEDDLPDDGGTDRVHGPLRPIDHEASGGRRRACQTRRDAPVLREDIHRMGSRYPAPRRAMRSGAIILMKTSS